MKTSISEENLVQQFLSGVAMQGTIVRTITRGNGDVDRRALPNVVTALGLNHLASRAIADTGSRYGWIGVGTANYTPHINSQSIGESSRKAAALISNSRELIVAVATWGGAADSVTSQSLSMAGIANHPSVGSGHFLNVVNDVSTVLADSDFLHLEVRVRVGSHNVT